MLCDEQFHFGDFGGVGGEAHLCPEHIGVFGIGDDELGVGRAVSSVVAAAVVGYDERSCDDASFGGKGFEILGVGGYIGEGGGVAF